jgi:hypothetical protein
MPFVAAGSTAFGMSIVHNYPANSSYLCLGILGTGLLIEFGAYKLRQIRSRHAQRAIELYNQSVLM